MKSGIWMTVFLCVACRPEPGDPDYPEPDDISFGDEDDGLLDGPDPYEEGDERLSLGAFYEGGYSEIVAIDDVTNHYYIYSSTYTQDSDLQDRVEGRVSDVLIMGSAGWFGGGIHWDGGGDLSDWTTLFVSMRSNDEGLENTEIRMTGGVEGGVSLADYGFAADGEWHELEIPLADIEDAGVDLSTITVALMFIGEGVVEGDELKVDNLYLTKD